MHESSPSRTAQATAYLRALHLYIDDAPAVFSDQLAIDLLPVLQQQQIRGLGRLARRVPRRLRPAEVAFTAIRAQVVVRARFAEDALSAARKLGVSRYVILGAGLDTFALRQQAPKIDVVEIDHPATQTWKCELLHRRNLRLPPELSLTAVDFEKTTLGSAWTSSEAMDFISWLGTTYYLSRDSIRSTLATLARVTRPGSRLVLDYWREKPESLIGTALLWGTRLAVAAQGEPLRSLLSPMEMEQMARDTGWQVLEHCSPADQNARYLHHRRDGLVVPGFAHLLHLQHQGTFDGGSATR